MGTAVVPKQRTISEDADRLTILEALLSGKSIKTVALDVGFHHTQVQMVAYAHGWPDPKRTAWSRDLLVERIAHPEGAAPVKSTPEPAAAAAPRSEPPKAKQPKPQAPALRKPQPAAKPTPPPAPVVQMRPAGTAGPNPRPSSVGSLSDLIDRGRASSEPSIRALAEVVALAVPALRAALVVPDRSVTRPPGIERYSDRLARLGVTHRDLRAWALEHHLDAGNGPRIRTEVVNAYEAAQR